MIKINISDVKLENIKYEYFRELEWSFPEEHDNDIQRHWVVNVERIVKASPESFADIISEFSKLDQSGFGEFKKDMEVLYKNVNTLRLMEELNINTCHYCNRNYTFTIEKDPPIVGNKVIKPQFDHFYPKSKYPYLALSFYNLIPSCPTCNFVKNQAEIGMNPYQKGFDDDGCKFGLKINGFAKSDCKSWLDYEIKFKSTNREIEKNIDVFGLKELYNEHKDYVDEIIDKSKAYNSACYESLIRSFSGLGKTPAEIDRYIWGSYLETAEHGKRPLSKLTRDILEQFGIK